MHNNNIHKDGYNFDDLVKANVFLKKFVFKNEYDKISIDFSNSQAVYHLNKALLIKHYGVLNWDIPKNALCPPIPSRAEYIHIINDLIKKIPNQTDVIKGLDIGVGTNCIFPILGNSIYGWKFKGTDVDENAISFAKLNIKQNPRIDKHVTIVHQNDKSHIFKGIINDEEDFQFSVCNPPFYSSKEEALKASSRKWKNLNQHNNINTLNFGGTANELWCNGGELLFIKRMIKESVLFKNQVFWFTSLVSQKVNLKPLLKILNKFKVKSIVVPFSIGNKQSRILAWTFKDFNE